MRVRSQNKKLLIDFDTVGTTHVGRQDDKYRIVFYTNSLVEHTMGSYSTQTQALKVLDMIQTAYLQPTYTNTIAENETATYENNVFEMPDECEVSAVCFKLK